MLTQKQYDLLLFIHSFLRQKGVSPSFDEMREGIHLKSKSGVHRLIGGLVERGYLSRLNNRARALEVLRLPENAARETFPARNPRSEQLRSTPLANMRQTFTNSLTMVAQLPLYGRIAAGTPIEALRDETMMVEVPTTMLGKGDHYALEVEGDSMIEAGILDGDTVVIERCERAGIGDIIVALVEDSEATLKRYRQDGDKILLEPANRHYLTRSYRGDQVKIQGRLVGLMRKY